MDHLRVSSDSKSTNKEYKLCILSEDGVGKYWHIWNGLLLTKIFALKTKICFIENIYSGAWFIYK
jgi:hypothetical protein